MTFGYFIIGPVIPLLRDPKTAVPTAIVLGGLIYGTYTLLMVSLGFAEFYDYDFAQMGEDADTGYFK